MISTSRETLAAEAQEFLALLAHENLLTSPFEERLRQVRSQIATSGTYRQTTEELIHGARFAWRNSIRCVGRKYWSSLAVHDCRQSTTAEEVFRKVVEHLRWSTHGGKIRPLISIFAPAEPAGAGIRIWNDQLIRYAGYPQPDGSVFGDPRQVELSAVLERLGWSKPPAERTRFDLLPLAIEVPPAAPRLFELPAEAVLEVEISHPAYPWFAGLGLKWHALPAISNMALEIGGLRYTAAPFSGWYMLTEIGVRNFADEDRYNLLPEIAGRLGLDGRSHRSLWKDRALVELNAAVLHSFEQAGVKMIDHHTATRHFVEFEAREAECGRPTYAEWGWIVPPLSGSITPVFHRPYESRELKPNFFVQPSPWQATVRAHCPHLAGTADHGLP